MASLLLGRPVVVVVVVGEDGLQLRVSQLKKLLDLNQRLKPGNLGRGGNGGKQPGQRE